MMIAVPTAAPPVLAFALPAFDALEKIVVFLVMLSVLVVLHEAGHFLLARRNGVRVNDFAVGFGPTLLKWTSPRSGTNYRINLLPLGGYCAMQGEDGGKSEAEQQREFRESLAAGPGAATPAGGAGVALAERTAVGALPRLDPATTAAAGADNFQAKTPWQRLSIVVAGPFANFILAYVIVFVAAITFGIPSKNVSPQIGILVAGSPAMKAGFQTGDQIVAIDGRSYPTGEAIVTKIHGSSGHRLAITIRRRGVVSTIPVTPLAAKVGTRTEGRIGFVAVPAFERVGVLRAFPVAATEFAALITGQVQGYAELFSHFRQNAGSLSGVIGMERAASVVQDLGWGPYLNLAATISIALGLLNLLPFPALDGGRAVFIIAELVRGRPVEPEKEALVHVTGFAVLMVLMVFVAFHDITNIVSGKGVF